MMKQQPIKDKQKLFKKLFISPSYCQPLDPPLLVSPDFIHLLLQQSANASRQYKRKLVDDILNVFTQRPTNSLLLCEHDQNKLDGEKCILDSVILRILELVSTEEQIEIYLEKIILMVAYYRITLRNLRKLTQWVSKMSFIQKFQPIKLMFIVRLLQIYYSKKLGMHKSPHHYFYIFGSDNTGIHPVPNLTNQLSFKHQLTIVLSFNSQGQPYKPYNLFLLKTQKKQQIGMTYAQGCLKITALNDGQFLDEFVVMRGLSEQIWYRLIINLNTNQTQCIVDNQAYRGRALLRKQKQRKISACVFGRQLFGMIGNSFICNKNLPLQKFDTSTYPYGLDTITNLISMNKSSLVPSVILSCLPLFTFEVREVKHCFDIFRRNHSSISENIIVVDQAIFQDNLQHLGGCTILLPLFYLARFYDRQTYPYLLEDLLKIFLDILKAYDIEALEKQFQETNFLEILGQHLSDIPHLQTQKSINMIFTIYQRFKKQKTKITYFRQLIWALNIGIEAPTSSKNPTKKQPKRKDNFSLAFQNSKIQKLQEQLSSPTKILHHSISDIISFYYKKLLQLYKKDPILTYKAMSLAQVIYWAVQYLQSNQTVAFSCCLQHHLNQSILTYEMKLQDIMKLDSLHTRTHYFHLQEVLSNYLDMTIKKPEQNISQQFKILLRLFLQKYSACFYLTILRAIKRQILLSTNSPKTIFKILTDPKLQIISFLVFLSQKTINPDIISQIMYLSLFFIKYTNSSKKAEQLNRFIVNLIKINQQIQIKTINPIKLSVQKVRKCSQDITCQISKESVELKSQIKYNLQYQNRKPSKPELDRHKLTKIIQRCPKPEKLSTYQLIYNIILNQLSNQVSQNEPTNQGTFYSQGSIMILKQYYILAHPLFKQSILLFILSSLEKNPQLKNINILTIFLLQSLRESIFVSPEQTKSLLTIFTCIFSQILGGHSDVVQYYCSIKFLKISRSAVSLVLPHVMSKVIKLADLSQLCQLMMISFYEITQSCSQSSLQLSKMILCEINNKVLKRTNITKIKKSKSQQKGDQKKECQQQDQLQLFTKILCENNDIDSDFGLKDPFRKQQEQQEQKKEGQQAIYQTIVLQQFQYDKKIEEDQNKRDLKDQYIRINQQKTFYNQRAQQKIHYNYLKQLKAIEIYIKLFFKVIQNIQFVDLNKRQSMADLQNASLIRKSNSAQINYVYQFKDKNQLIKDFIQIMIIYFNNIAQGKIQADRSFVQFILSFVLYKIQKSKIAIQGKISSEEIIISIIENTCLPFIIEEVSSLQQLCRLIAEQDTRLTFLLYFCKLPFKFKLGNFTAWKKDRKALQESFKDSQICQILIQQPKYKKFFDQIQDIHDLIIVGFYQKRIQKYIQIHENLMANFASQKSFRNIQKLFDNQNASQQRTRMTYLYENQCKFRKSHYQWDLIWNKMRTYHQPYGFWMAQKFKDSQYVYPQKQIKNFKFQMSQYSSTSGFYPVLEAKIIQPWAIVKDNKIKKSRYINSFSQMMKPTHIDTQNSQSKDNVLTNLWKGMLGMKKRSNNKINQYEVVLICRSTKATGKIFIQNKQDLIFCYEGARQEDNHLSFQKFSLAFNRQTYQKWNIYTIQNIRVHRYLLRYQALQIIFNDGRSIIFDFINQDKDKFIKEIQKIQKQKLQANNQKLYKLNKISFLDDNFFQYRGLDWKITQSWIRRQISNLQYLIKVNKAASRGIYDLSQYSVAPWVVQFRKQKEPRYRDLSKTMGALGSQQRKKIVSQKYFAKDPFNPCPPFFFGTHYSSPGVVFNLLIRLSPFTQYCKHLQGGKFDIPDRLFSSMISAWRSASEQVSDVRQLIPQMYYLPQIYINIDDNYFGYTQNSQLVNHIQIPPWGANNPYYFTSQLRQIMESQQVSQKINQWIDLIFGYKQRGKEAQNNFNIYYYLTYEDYIDAEQEQDEVYKKSRQAQVVHFGQIPPQLFEKPHPKRNKPQGDSLYQLKIIKSINLMNTLKQKPIGLKITNNQLIICKRNEYEVYSTQSDPAALQKKKKFNFEKSISQTYYMIKKQRSNVLFLEKPFFIIWGYLSNQFRIFNKNTGEISQSAQLSSRITALHVSQAEDLLIAGSVCGVLQIFQIQHAINDIFLSRIAIEYFPSPIVHISEFDGFYAITFGNYTAIYKISRCLRYITSAQSKPVVKFFRSFYNPLPLKASYIMGSPLYTIILIDNANIKSYSINGQFIKNMTSSAKYYGRFKDGQLHDVFYAIDEDKAICLSVPDLRSIGILQLPKYEQLTETYIINKSTIQQIGYTCR